MVATSARYALAPTYTKLQATALNSVLTLRAVVGKFLIFVTPQDTVTFVQTVIAKVTKPFTEQPSVDDVFELEVRKAQSEALSFTDEDTKSVSKSVLENVFNISGAYFAEDYVDGDYTAIDVKFSITKPFTESLGIIDVIVPVLIRPVVDTPSLTDAIAFYYSKDISDLFAVSDTPALKVTKPVQDNFSVAETSVAAVTKVVTESPSVADTPVFDVSKIISDLPSVADVPTLAITKPLTDSFSVAEAHVARYTKAVSDGMGVSESSVLEVSKAVTDSVGTTDSGTLRMQDYCDFTYFAEDYVGTSASF